MNATTNPRIFRGRGGPTDRRLPKYNARRRRRRPPQPPPPTQEEQPSQESSSIITTPTDPLTSVLCNSEDECQKSNFFGEDQQHVMIHDNSHTNSMKEDDDDNDDDDDDDENQQQLMTLFVKDLPPSPRRPDVCNEFHTRTNDDDLYCAALNNNNNNGVDGVVDDNHVDNEPWRNELHHLHRRIRNIRESIQLSPQAISHPSTYQQNVLHAVTNCVQEWRSIARQYYVPIFQSLHPDLYRATSLQIFELTQHSLQCGPLAGGKPGYFKRCGGVVAKMVETYLDDMITNPDDARALGWTDKQVDALETWRKHAKIAAMADKPPSKSAKLKQIGTTKNKKK